MDFLVEPFEAEFIQIGALAAGVVGVLCAVVGCYVILRGQALVADSLAHGVLPGVAIAFVLTSAGTTSEPSDAALWVGALAAGIFTAVATNWVLRRSEVREETATAIVFVLMLALGVVVVSRVEGYTVDLTSFLFGDVLGVTGDEVLVAAVLTAAVLAAVAFFYRQFLIVSFDPQRAAAMGLPVQRLDLLMLLMVTVAVVIGFRVVGSLLVLGLLIAPPAAASLLTSTLPRMMLVAAGIAAASAPIGLLISWHLDVAAGGAIVLVAVAAFPAALLLSPRRA